MTTANEDLRSRLENLKWTDLRKTAREEFGYKFRAEDGKETIINACLALADVSKVSQKADLSKAPAPGFVRVRINTHDRAGGKDPVQLSVNNYDYLALRGRVVDVPLKYLEVLRNAVNDLVCPDGATFSDDGEDATKFLDICEEQHDYSFELLGQTPGPDPRVSGLERALRRKTEQRKKFARDKMGLPWATDYQVAQAMGKPHIKDRMAG